MAPGEGEEETTDAAAVRFPPTARAVFISYASADRAPAEAVCAALEREGLPCWMAPRDVIPGEFYAEGIVHAIDATTTLVVVLSEHSAASPHVLREVERASARRHPVIAFRLDLAPLPAALEYFLNTSHWLDASATGARAALPQLIDAVRRVSRAPASPDAGRSGAAMAPRAGAKRASRARPGWPLLALVLAAAAAGAYLLIARPWQALSRAGDPSAAVATGPDAAPPAAAPERSVAVLPFVDMSEKKDQEYFADGLAEQLLDRLSQIRTLQVAARTSAFSFKGKPDDIRTIARKLLVANVLEGSVRKAGAHLRVTAQLIRADNGYHLWSETFDSTADDIFKVQDRISAAVATALQASLTSAAPVPHGTRNAEANDLYLQARFHLFQLADGGEEKAVDLAKRAIALDPNFAAAWAILSRATLHESIELPSASPKVAEFKVAARHAAEKAVQLDPALGAAHLALGRVYEFLDLNLTEAEAEFRRARELDPRDADARLQLANVAGDRGLLAERLRLNREALALDPLNVNILEELGESCIAMRRYAEAEAVFRKLLGLAPTEQYAGPQLGESLLLQGKPAEALETVERFSTDEPSRRYMRALAYSALGRGAEADAIIATLDREPDTVGLSSLAYLHAYRGDTEGAFRWLDRAALEMPIVLRGELVVDPPLLDRIKADPRYKALLRRLDVPAPVR